MRSALPTPPQESWPTIDESHVARMLLSRPMMIEHSAVDPAVSVPFAVHDKNGTIVGAMDGVAVGILVGDDDGVAVGAPDGAAVGVAVGTLVGVEVGDAVGLHVTISYDACTVGYNKPPALMFRGELMMLATAS